MNTRPSWNNSRTIAAEPRADGEVPHFDPGRITRAEQYDFMELAATRRNELSHSVALIASVLPPTNPEINWNNASDYYENGPQTQARRADVDRRMAELPARQNGQTALSTHSKVQQPQYVKSLTNQPPRAQAAAANIDVRIAAASADAQRFATPGSEVPLYANPNQSSGDVHARPAAAAPAHLTAMATPPTFEGSVDSDARSREALAREAIEQIYGPADTSLDMEPDQWADGLGGVSPNAYGGSDGYV